MDATFFDSHCHFDFAAFDPDRAEVWRRCREQGLNELVVPGVAPAQWPKAARVSADHEGIYYGVGVHPWWLKEVWKLDQLSDRDLEQLRGDLHKAAEAESAGQRRCVAIGECGLDLASGQSPLAMQEQVLALHLEVAQALEMPVIIHSVKAHNPLLRLLKRYPLKRGGVIHAFTGSLEMGQEYWRLGFFLGAGGTITYERAHKTRHAVAQMPLEALLLETDAPDMPLCGHQGERNSPERIPQVARSLAELRGQTIEEVAMQTTANSRKLFGLV